MNKNKQRRFRIGDWVKHPRYDRYFQILTIDFSDFSKRSFFRIGPGDWLCNERLCEVDQFTLFLEKLKDGMNEKSEV